MLKGSSGLLNYNMKVGGGSEIHIRKSDEKIRRSMAQR
jgi:hypothetical protein